MRLTPREQEKLLIVVGGEPARGRKARDPKLHHPKATAILTAGLLGGMCDGDSIAYPTGAAWPT
ncbi:MAG: hypothetical protein NVSMB65_06170 [Chloroflexota bacterium]